MHAQYDRVLDALTEKLPAVAAHVTRVRGGGRIALFHGLRHRGIADHACPSAVAHSLELAIPIRRG